MKLLFSYLLILCLLIKANFKKNDLKKHFFDKSIDPSLFSQVNSYYSGLLNKISQIDQIPTQNNNETSDSDFNQIENETNELINELDGKENTKKDQIKIETVAKIENSAIIPIDSILPNNTSLFDDFKEKDNDKIAFEEIPPQNYSQKIVENTIPEKLNTQENNTLFSFVSQEIKENPPENLYRQTLPPNFLQEDDNPITEGSFFSQSHSDNSLNPMNRKTFFLKKKHHQNPPFSFQSEESNKQITSTLLKEKVLNLTAMVDQYLQYKDKNQKKINQNKIILQNKEFLSRKNQTEPVVQDDEILGIDDNFFDNENELYQFYGAIPHFISYNNM